VPKGYFPLNDFTLLLSPSLFWVLFIYISSIYVCFFFSSQKKNPSRMAIFQPPLPPPSLQWKSLRINPERRPAPLPFSGRPALRSSVNANFLTIRPHPFFIIKILFLLISSPPPLYNNACSRFPYMLPGHRFGGGGSFFLTFSQHLSGPLWKRFILFVAGRWGFPPTFC